MFVFAVPATANFNPRSPDGERLGLLIVIIYFQIFQSTLPGWGATIQSSMWPVSWKFQSTLPGWGATCPRRCRSCRRWHFNPRSPDGERLRGHVPPVRRVRISIHAPRMGSDSGYGARRQGSYISIHAPRMGSDSWRPRATVIIMIFQSTLPGWGATLMLLEAVHGIVISIHAPRMGSDHTPSLAGFDCKDFNPRSPDGERPRLTAVGYIIVYISIHAPRMGSDSMLGVQMLSGYDDFNPRSPDGERPGISISVVPEALISIHAPRMGSDQSALIAGLCYEISIHAPRMGSDVYVPRLRFVSRDFNPRSPDGERPIGLDSRPVLRDFNPRSPDGERRLRSPVAICFT